MKRLFSGFLISIFLYSTALADIQIDTSDIPLSVCAGQWGFLDASGELDDFNWSINSWGNTFSEAKDWSPNYAGIQIRSDLQGYYKIILRFQMSSSDIARLETTFDGTSTRIPTALEVDILDKNNVLGDPGVNDFSIISTNIPSEALLQEDVSASDSMNQLSAIIMRPDKLRANTLYEIVFEPNGNVQSGLSAKFQMNWQLSINYKWITAMKNNSSSQCDLMAVIDYLKDEVDDGHYSSGFSLVTDNYSNDIPSGALSGWYYFAGSKLDVSNDESVVTGNGLLKDLVCWDDNLDPGHNVSSDSKCNDGNGHNLFMDPTGSYYPYYGNNGTDENPEIITIDNHTHVIAPSYRCSQEIGEPILCWELGGDTNCWDAWKWYQFNGDVYEVADHHNDSDWITSLNRDYTCNEVYSSGSGDSGSDGNSGPGYTDDTNGNTWDGYAHHVGLKYMKIGKKSSGHWSGKCL